MLLLSWASAALRGGVPVAMKVMTTALLLACGGRTAISECAGPEGRPLVCTTACGEGTQLCMGGVLTPCAVPPTEVACENACGAGRAICIDGVIGACVVEPRRVQCDNPCGRGTAACVDGVRGECEVEPVVSSCTTPCGDGVSTCQDGVQGGCEVPPVRLPCTNLCGAGRALCEGAMLGRCEVAPLEVPCSTECGSGVERCEDGVFGVCSADQSLPPQLAVRIRDFRRIHPDFESRLGRDPGIVEELLGPDGKPVYAGVTPTTSGQAAFDQWYRDVPGVNLGIDIAVELTLEDDGLFTFTDLNFFPIDGLGFGNEGRRHNYHFTLEATTDVVYSGGEIFRFSGDDDVFVFINGHLAIDLGGVHARQTGTVSLDDVAAEFGLVPGERYPVHLFFAERHTLGSTFTIETSLAATFRCE